MNLHFMFRTYSTYGANATLALAGTWLSRRLAPSYGGEVGAVWVVGRCRNVSPPKKTLEDLHSRFEESFSRLPQMSFVPEAREIELAYDAIRFTHDDVVRDRQVLALWTFRHVVGKAADLARRLAEWPRCPAGFDHAALSRDIASALKDAPQSLEDLVEVFQALHDGAT